jgi:hypothetical protein
MINGACMKLLPKPRGKVSRKPIVGTEKELKNKIAITKCFSDESRKRLSYNFYAKKLIRDNPGIIKAVENLRLNISEKRYVDPKGNFEILKVTDLIKNYKRTLQPACTSDAFYINVKEGLKTHKFYLKVSHSINIINELPLPNGFEKCAKEVGLDLIKSHLEFEKVGYYDENHHFDKIKYTLYDLSFDVAVSDALQHRLINMDIFLDISDKIYLFEYKLITEGYVAKDKAFF